MACLLLLILLIGVSQADICFGPTNTSLGIGAGYSGLTPPTNGLMVQGNTGLQCTTPLSALDVNGGSAHGTCACTSTAPTNGGSYSGHVWIGTCNYVYTSTGSEAILTLVSAAEYVGAGYSTAIASTTGGPVFALYQNALGKAVNVTGARIGTYSFGGSKNTSNALVDTASITAVTTEAWSGTATGTDVLVEATAIGNTTKAEVVRFTGAGPLRLAQRTNTQITAIASPANGEIVYDATYAMLKMRVNGAWKLIWNEKKHQGVWSVRDTGSGIWTGSGSMSVGAAVANVAYDRYVTTPANATWMQLNPAVEYVTGVYILEFSVEFGTSYGYFTVTEQNTTATILPRVDMYSVAGTMISSTLSTNVFYFTAPTTPAFRWTVTGKNAASSSYTGPLTQSIHLYKLE